MGEAASSDRLDRRLVELFKRASKLAGAERRRFLDDLRGVDASLAESLDELLRQEGGPVPEEPTSFANKLEQAYGPEADPEITLDPVEEPGSDFPSGVVKRLAHRGETYERYSLKGQIAHGGQGAILRVWDEDLRRNLAMKVVLGKDEKKGETPPIDSRTLGRFLEEAQVTGQLDHPGIVPVHELGLDSEGRVYFTMKLVKGSNLKVIFDLVHEGLQDWTQMRALAVMLKICEAMSYAHAKGVIHRDLKPSNVMVGRYGEVYVMDWGLARITGHSDGRDLRIRPDGLTTELRSERHDADPDSPLVTMDGDVVGTPSYMSPEQAFGNLKEMGPHSDVYAAGAMLYHLLTGQMPYVPPGARLSNYAIWTLVQKGPPVSVHELADCPVELAAICEKAMARRPADRYPDMRALGEDLQAYLENRVVGAYERGPIAELRKWTRRNRGFATSIAAAIVTVVAGLLLFLWFRSVSERERVLDSDAYLLQYLIAGEADLWPADPAKLPEIDDWLASARELLDREAEHAERFDRRRASGLAETVATLREGQLLDDLIPFADQEAGLVQRVEDLRRFASTLAERTIESEEARRLWREAIASISDREASPDYGGLVIEPQLGLLPLGKSPTGLWEFWHVASGDRPELEDPDAWIYRLTPETGIVLVLLPGGPFEMGAPGEEHHVVLKPFFMGKFEVTQGQWLRLFGENPARFQPESTKEFEFSLLHPVERVTWFDSVELAHRLGLRLPTESQWEYACRAGSRTAYPEGDDYASFGGFENVGDVQTGKHRPQGSAVVEWDDGYPFTAPVGSFLSNIFGLHDMNGNVSEWCDGTPDPYPEDSDFPTNGRIFDEENDDRVWRGAIWHNHPALFRSDYRRGDRARSTNESRGLRVARDLDG